MSHRISKTALGTLAGMLCLAGSSALATQVKVTVENLNPEGGLFLTPVFFGFHNGSFDTFDVGAPASAALEPLAEDGIVGPMLDSIAGVGGAKSMALPSAAGPYAPGTSNSFIIDLDPDSNGYLTYASMVIPSNDAFIGNDNPLAYGLFNADGSLKDGFSFDVSGADIWDAGTEENDGMDAAFSLIGGTSTTTAGVVTQHPGLNNFVGTAIAAGGTLQTAFAANTSIARISVSSQVPDSTQYIGLLSIFSVAGFFALTRRPKAVKIN